MSIKRCPYCNKILPDFLKEEKKQSFTSNENELFQNECLKIHRRIEKLQYKHDYEDLSNWKLNQVNDQLNVLNRILEILEREI